MRRCNAACTDGDITSSTVSRTSAWTNWYVNSRPPTLTRNPLSTSSSSPAATSSAAIPDGQRQHPEFDALTGDGGELERTAGPPRQPRHAAADDLLDRIGRADAADVAPHHPAVVAGARTTPWWIRWRHSSPRKNALPPLRSAGRSGEHAQIAVELLAECAGDVLLDAGRVEPPDADPGDGFAALQVDEAFGQRIGELGGAVAERGDDHRARRPSRTARDVAAAPASGDPPSARRRAATSSGRRLGGDSTARDRRPRTAGTARSRDRPATGRDSPGNSRSSCGSSTSRSARSRSLIDGRPKSGRERSR